MKAFFQKIVSFLHILFGVDLDTWISQHVQPSIEFVENLKRIVDSPVANILTALIPGDADDKVRAFFSNNLTKAINLLHLTNDIVSETDFTNKILKTATYLRNSSDSMRAAIYKQLAADLSKLSAGTSTIKNHSVDLLVQMQYSKMKEGVTADSLQTNIDNTPGATVLPEPSTNDVNQPDLTPLAQAIASVSDVITTAVADPAPAETVAPVEQSAAPAPVEVVADAAPVAGTAPIDNTPAPVESVATEANNIPPVAEQPAVNN